MGTEGSSTHMMVNLDMFRHTSSETEWVLMTMRRGNVKNLF